MNQIKVNYESELLLLLLRKESHGRELSKQLSTSLTRTQAILNNLRDNNVIDYKVEGRNHIYFIKKNLIAKSFILTAENYKLTKFLKKHPHLEPLFKDITNHTNNLTILFGSYAKFTSKEDSDIDIYIENITKKEKEHIQSINHSLSIKTGDFNPNDLLIKEIINNHVIIQGGEIFYERLGFFK